MGEEGQGSQLLRELAKIELQAAVGNDLVESIGRYIAELALSSPSNLRLARHLLTLRTHDENGYEGDEMGEEWESLMADAEDSLQIKGLWDLLLEAEEMTRHPERADIRVWSQGIPPAITQIARVFARLEIRLGSYEIVHKVEGRNRLSEEIVPIPEELGDTFDQGDREMSSAEDAFDGWEQS